MMFMLAISMVAGLQAGNASRYGYVGDTWNRAGTFACRGSLQARYGDRRWRTMRDHGVAHRTLACGTPLAICNLRNARCTTAFVVDRGPYGALDRRGVWHARIPPLHPGEHYRGQLDLLPGVYSAISLVGIEPVMYWQLPVSQPEPEYRRPMRPRMQAFWGSPFALNFTKARTGDLGRISQRRDSVGQEARGMAVDPSDAWIPAPTSGEHTFGNEDQPYSNERAG